MNRLRTLGKSGLCVSSIGLGCMGMSHAYGAPSSLTEMRNLFAEAVDMGMTFFDTAEVYGTPEDPHHNETLVGNALAPYRNKVVIATKFGLSFGNPHAEGPHPLLPDSRPETIRIAVEGSLKRLNTDHIDLYYQHRIDPSVSPEEVAGTISQLIEEGKVLHWGISEANEEYLRRAHAVCPVTAIQNRYSMMARRYERLFPVLEELGIGFVAFSPLANGFLTGGYTADSKFDAATDYRAVMPQFRRESFEENKELMTMLQDIANDKQATLAQISLAWMLNKKPWIVPIPGTRRLDRLRENAGAMDVSLNDDEIRKIDLVLDSIKMSEVFGGSKIVKQ